jgi:hypothetical protein
MTMPCRALQLTYSARAKRRMEEPDRGCSPRTTEPAPQVGGWLLPVA